MRPCGRPSGRWRPAIHPHRPHEIVDRAGRHTLDISLLDHRRERLLRHAPRLQKAGKVAAPPELRDAQLHRAGARLPQPIALAVAVIEPIGMPLAMRRSRSIDARQSAADRRPSSSPEACSVVEERLRFVARILEGETMSDVCRSFGISRKTGYKIFNRYKESGLEALTDRSRRPVRYANQLPEQIETLIVRC